MVETTTVDDVDDWHKSALLECVSWDGDVDVQAVLRGSISVMVLGASITEVGEIVSLAFEVELDQRLGPSHLLEWRDGVWDTSEVDDTVAVLTDEDGSVGEGESGLTILIDAESSSLQVLGSVEEVLVDELAVVGHFWETVVGELIDPVNALARLVGLFDVDVLGATSWGVVVTLGVGISASLGLDGAVLFAVDAELDIASDLDLLGLDAGVAGEGVEGETGLLGLEVLVDGASLGDSESVRVAVVLDDLSRDGSSTTEVDRAVGDVELDEVLVSAPLDVSPDAGTDVGKSVDGCVSGLVGEEVEREGGGEIAVGGELAIGNSANYVVVLAGDADSGVVDARSGEGGRSGRVVKLEVSNVDGGTGVLAELEGEVDVSVGGGGSGHAAVTQVALDAVLTIFEFGVGEKGR